MKAKTQALWTPNPSLVCKMLDDPKIEVLFVTESISAYMVFYRRLKK